MAYRAIARGAVACAAATSAVGALAAVLCAGPATAAPGTINWTDGSSQFTRTISNTSPKEGDVITVSTQFARNSIVDEYIYSIKDEHPACLTYVAGSAKMNNGTTDYPYEDPEVVPNDGGSGYVGVSFSITNWPVMNRPLAHQSPVFSVQYKVGHDCTPGTALTTGMEYSGSLGSGHYSTQGPSITVSQSTTTTTTTTPPPVTGPGTGTGSAFAGLGSLSAAK
ncbi:hypothetical protein [Nocardia stercoris]|uniref:Uncharacterized protein n=1 Tax=Nocardia stercoris TaxID=2483361 RepID=A0A3M2KR90_9NOCA|nr:hypothetical protein [Nocardia stercoris]RMI27591.1 hypothetical protein EBN03_33465 [Nocardia stercoris]